MGFVGLLRSLPVSLGFLLFLSVFCGSLPSRWVSFVSNRVSAVLFGPLVSHRVWVHSGIFRICSCHVGFHLSLEFRLLHPDLACVIGISFASSRSHMLRSELLGFTRAPSASFGFQKIHLDFVFFSDFLGSIRVSGLLCFAWDLVFFLSVPRRYSPARNWVIPGLIG